MTPYKEYFIKIHKRRAQKFIMDLNKNEYENIVFKIRDLTTEKYDLLDIKSLKGYDNLYRISIND